MLFTLLSVASALGFLGGMITTLLVAFLGGYFVMRRAVSK